MISRLPIALVCSAVLIASTAVGQERKVTRQQLPAAVARTADSLSVGAVIRGYSQMKEHGQTLYELELTVNSRSKDIRIDSTGAVLEVEEQVALADLPDSVRARLKAKVGKGKITLVESITRGGKLEAYEAQVVTDGKHSEVTVEP